jgi:hypothetical protein
MSQSYAVDRDVLSTYQAARESMTVALRIVANARGEAPSNETGPLRAMVDLVHLGDVLVFALRRARHDAQPLRTAFRKLRLSPTQLVTACGFLRDSAIVAGAEVARRVYATALDGESQKPGDLYDDTLSAAELWRRASERIRSMPAVDAAALVELMNQELLEAGRPGDQALDTIEDWTPEPWANPFKNHRQETAPPAKASTAQPLPVSPKPAPVTAEEANRQLRKLFTDDPELRLTQREAARRIGCSTGTIANTPVWKARHEKTRRRFKRRPRSVPLTDVIADAYPDRSQMDPQLEALVREQQQDARTDQRRSRARERS